MTMHGGVCVIVDADETKIQRSLDAGFLDLRATSLEEAIEFLISKYERKAGKN